ncbi:MAG: carbohydrate kinase family protein, partial [Candidatus Helarchaeales archaeon]
RARLLHTSFVHEDVAEFVISNARKRNPEIKVSLDLEKQVIIKHGVEKILNFLDSVDILVPQKQGIKELMRTDDILSGARKLMKKKQNIELLALTLGEDGCMIFQRTEHSIREIRDKGFKIKPVDVTGAGDAFNAALAVGYLKGWNVEDIATFANAAGALNCLKVGARAGMEKMDAIMDFIKSHGRNFLK